MPYTLAHAVISLPFSLASRGKIPVAALVVGSMSPDFPYLWALTPVDAPGHSLSGIFVYCLIPSLAMLLVWYRWLERPTLDLLHLPYSNWRLGAKSLLLAILGVFLGACTHVLWDNTSHPHGSLVVGSEFWHQEILSLPLYKWSQYGGGVMGLAGLSVWYVLAAFGNRHEPYKGQLAAGLILHALSIGCFILLANTVHGSAGFSDWVVRSAIGLIVGTLFGMCLHALWMRVQSQRRPL